MDYTILKAEDVHDFCKWLLKYKHYGLQDMFLGIVSI
jgi:hypothetical protein